MKVLIKCPFCNQRYELDEFREGQEAECENCHRSFTICMAVLDVSSGQRPHDMQITTHAPQQGIKAKTSEGNKGENIMGNSAKSEAEKRILDSNGSPVESWMDGKLGNDNKNEVGNHIKDFLSENHDENWLVNWQKSIKPNQIKENDLVYLNTINNAITIWTWWTTIVKILFVCSLPISIIAICVMLENDNCSNAFCRLWIPVTIFIVIQLFFAWLFSLFSQAVLESFRALNNNTKVIVSAIASLKDGTIK
jgi:hypothetical protein